MRMINNRIGRKNLIGIFLFILPVFVMLSVNVRASPTQYFQPSPFSYYSASIDTYWPAFGKEECLARQDFIIQILPGGCSPAVIRSDLLEEQDVPVFCQLTGIKINPLIEVPEITSISFKGQQLPKEVAGIGFHPARAALKTYGSELLGSPVINDLGYLVVVVRRNQIEKNMTKWIEANLTALIQYNAERALGIGKAGFLLPVLSDDEWRQYYKQYSFWNGKAYLRALEIGKDSAGEYARIGIYLDVTRQLTSFILHAGESSQETYLPGYYCSAALKINLQSIAYPESKAKIRIGDDEMWLAKGQRFLDDNCWVKDIQPNIIGGGKTIISCKDGGPYNLEIDPPTATITIQDSAEHEIASDDFSVGQELVDGKGIYLGYVGSTDVAISANLRQANQDFIVLVKPENIDSEYFNNLNIIVNSILKGKKYSMFNLFSSLLKSLNPKADKSSIKWGEEVRCLTGCDYSLQKGLIDYFGSKATFRIIAAGGSSGQGSDFEGYHFTFGKITGSVEKNYNDVDFGKLLEKYFNEAEDAYKKVAEYYGDEKKPQGEEVEKGDYYGADALLKASELARDLGKFKTQEDLLNRIVKDYPTSGIAEKAQQDLDAMRVHDRTKASTFIHTAGTTYYTILEDIQEPGMDDKSVDLSVDGKAESYAENQIVEGSITVKEITEEYAAFSYQNKEGTIMPAVKVKQGDPITLSSYENNEEKKVSIRVTKINLKRDASVTITPSIMRAQTQTNFSFKIGIEKRALKLTPEKTQELINQLNTSIAQWESVVNNLGNLVKTWKATCFAGTAYFTVKSFLSNMGGGAGMARTEAMKHWKTICKGEIAEGKSSTFHDCYMKHANDIDKSVGTFKDVYAGVNSKADKIKSTTGVLEQSKGVFGSEQYINNTKYVQESQQYFNEYKDMVLESKDGKQKIKVGDVFNSKNMELLGEKGSFSTNDVRDTMFNLEVQKTCNDKKFDDAICNDIKQKIFDDANQWNKIASDLSEEEASLKKLKESGFEFIYTPETVKQKEAVEYTSKEVKKPSDAEKELLKKAGIEKADDISQLRFQLASGETALFITTLKSAGEENGVKIYDIVAAAKKNPDGSLTKASSDELKEIKSKIAQVKYLPPGALSNSYKNPEVKFWETGTYKGLPAVLPLGEYASKGWYVATEPYSLGTSSATKAFTESGQPISFWICNVNGNNLEEWETAGHGDDHPCQMFNMQTGMPLDEFSGLDKQEAAKMTKVARQYLLDAAKQYGKKSVSVGGNDAFKVGKPAVTIPQYECEDFMSPNDCHIMFNLCDPVLCPSSRCDFGGRYPVADVVQTGVIGSIALCFPNIREGIYVPICLTGIHAGLDNFVMILKATRDCLQENLNTGRTVGICDEIQSIYLCEFFWKQAIPLAKVGIPWIIDSISGKSSHGGGEYLFVQDSWSKMQDSVNYFTNYYGVNAFKAFQAKSTEAVGTEVCKAWVSARYPSTAAMFDKLLEPESPTQFYATLSEDILTEATVPATSHYKVYYRIYAGKDQGVYYNIYLKGQPQTEYYSQLAEMSVPSAVGYIPVGEQVDKATDFTGPAGYKELCVRINTQEECGFGQVTTSFAMDELKNIYLKEQATQPITKESDCIEGTSSVTAAVLNLNLQAGVSEVAQPAIYKRGIIRICASDNPSMTTEPTRWTSVGYCGDNKIKCWLDTLSLNQTITDRGILNQTLDEAKKLAKEIGDDTMWGKEQSEEAKLAADVDKTKLTESDGQIDKIISKSTDADKAEEEVEDAIKSTISNYNEVVSKSLLNQEKAQAQTEIAGIYEKIARSIYKNKIRGNEPLPDNIKVGVVLKASETKLTEDIKVIEIIETSAIAEGLTTKKNYRYNNGKWAEATIREIRKKNLATEQTGTDTEQEAVFLGVGENIDISFNGKSYPLQLDAIDEKGITFYVTTDSGSVTNFVYPEDKEFTLDLNGDEKSDFTVKINDRGSDFADIEITKIETKSIWQKIGEGISNLNPFKTEEAEAAEVSSADNWVRYSYSSSDFQDAQSESNFESRKNLYTLVDKYAEQYNVNFNIVRAIINVESKWDVKDQSATGAYGLMQLKDTAVGDMKDKTGACAKSMGAISINKYNTEQNINGGVRYLVCQLKRFGNLNLALAAYKAGPTAVEKNCNAGVWSKCKNKFKQEDKEYPDKVKDAYNLFSSSGITPSSSQTTKKKIVVDAGHGGSDPGAVNSEGINEKDINLAIAKKLKSILEGKDYSVKMTRETDATVSLASRVKIANDFSADIFVSIHINTFELDINGKYCSKNGAETFYYRTSTKSKEFAEIVQENVVSSLGVNDRGIKPDTESAEGSLYVLKNTNMPAVLVEPGFICNKEDMAKLSQESEKIQLASAVSQSISAFV